ncbi:MAG: hypothetical protein ACJ8ER_11955 [Allosphingosinicella sp.]
MEVEGDYAQDGYALVRGLIAPEVARAFLKGLEEELGGQPIALSRVTSHPNLLKRPAAEVYGHHYKPLAYFLWGLTPAVSALVGRELLPTYDYFRIYRRGDVCRVHSDRPSCEHSLSLTLDYSDDRAWELEVGRARHDEPSARVDEDWGGEPFTSLAMNPGDAVLYRGVEHRHGRVTPNPNGWSAHLFLHWVDREGPWREHAFDGQPEPGKADFRFS